MKKFYKPIILSITIAVLAISLFSFKAEKKKDHKTNSSYAITLLNVAVVGTNQVWTWSLNNPNPGNGSNGTLQDVSHWDFPLCALAESALVSAEYSLDGTNWVSNTIEMDRDPSIRLCTTTDVLKFNVGTIGTSTNYYRVTFNKQFLVNPFATSWIKTGGGLKGCNLYFYAGVGCEIVPGTRND